MLREILALLPRVVAVVGSFGSGKSEFAINLALEMAKENPGHVALVDLDIVNAYFRVREITELLKARGVKPVAPQGELAYGDLPIYGPGVKTLLKNQDCKVVLDVGGDDCGAVALAGLAEVMEDFLVMMVVNPFRPFTKDRASIEAMKKAIEEASRLPVNRLVSNPNLGWSTTPEIFEAGHQKVMEVAESQKLPVLCALAVEPLLTRWKRKPQTLGVPLVKMNVYLTPGWLVDQQLKEAERKQGF